MPLIRKIVAVGLDEEGGGFTQAHHHIVRVYGHCDAARAGEAELQLSEIDQIDIVVRVQIECSATGWNEAGPRACDTIDMRGEIEKVDIPVAVEIAVTGDGEEMQRGGPEQADLSAPWRRCP